MRSPDGPLRWLIRYVQTDLARATDREREAFRAGLRELLMLSAPAGAAVDLEAIQQLLEACVTELAGGAACSLSVPPGYWIFSKLEPRGPRAHATLHREFRTDDLPTQVVLEALELLQRAGVERLKACPYQPPADATGAAPRPCGQLFLAKGRQLYCGPAHTKRAVWQAWSAKNPRRKG